MKPLGKNKGGYFGETIDIKKVIDRMEAAAEKFDWERETYYETPEFRYRAFQRKNRSAETPTRNIYLSTGIHGDEPAGPMALLELLEKNEWPGNANVWLCPTLNPKGFVLNTRENEKCIDLNRDYRDKKTPEIKAHIDWLEKQPKFDLSLCLHEDWEAKGFYLYSLKGKTLLTDKIIEAVGKIFPIDLSFVIEDLPADGGVIHHNIDPDKRTEWPEAFYLRKYKDGVHHTFESASDFPLKNRVEALKVAVKAALEILPSN